MIDVTIDDQEARAAFAQLHKRGTDPRAYLTPIGALIKESTRLRFVSSSGPNGESWPPVLRGGSPLRNTGVHLMNAISYRVEGASVTVGVPYAWAAVHQFGKTITAKNAKYLAFRIGKAFIRKRSVRIPARPFLGLSPVDRTDIVSTLRRFLLPA